jgi:hypothetical protein
MNAIFREKSSQSGKSHFSALRVEKNRRFVLKAGGGK